MTIYKRDAEPSWRCLHEKLCSSRKYPYPPYGWSLEILRWWGYQDPKFLKQKHKAKLKFSEGWGVQTKETSVGRV